MIGMTTGVGSRASGVGSRWSRVGIRLAATTIVAATCLCDASAAFAQDSWALIVTGASGGQKYAEQLQSWRTELQTALVDRYGFAATRVQVLVDETTKTGEQATAKALRQAVSEVRRQIGRDDLFLVILLGHGTYDGEIAKFNLVGPDLTAADWSGLFEGMPGRLVLINTTESSFPFLAELSARGRVVITATDSSEQRYATVFPDYLVRALSEASTDLDKNGRTSIFEVFTTASIAVRQHYEQRGMLTTERAVIDDNGDKLGREEQVAGPDGVIAKTVNLEAPNPLEASDPAVAALLRRRRELEVEAEALKLKKTEMPPAAWEAEFEKLMIELAKVSQEIRRKS
jgi:hypothetical protein